MRLTTKGRFAVTAMLDLALHQDAGPTPLVAISKRQDISYSYLEQLFIHLRKKGLVVAMRGPGGGYLLAQKADTINIANIIAAVEEPVDTTRCGGKKNCGIQGNPCMTHNLWTLLNQQILDFLHSISLQQLMDNQRVKKPLISTSKSISPVLYIDSCYERQITLTTR